MFIVVVGNPVDGLQFWGPFESSMEASEWANSRGLLGSYASCETCEGYGTLQKNDWGSIGEPS